MLVTTSETFPAGREDVKEWRAATIKRPSKRKKKQKQDENRNDLHGNIIN